VAKERLTTCEEGELYFVGGLLRLEKKNKGTTTFNEEGCGELLIHPNKYLFTMGVASQEGFR